MNNSIFLVSNDFFDSEIDHIEVSSNIEESANSEKLCLVYDPIANVFFEEAAKIDRDLFELTLFNFFNELESHNKNSLPWYCIDNRSSVYINNLSELIMNLNYMTRAVYSFGCIPVSYDFTFFLYFFITSSSLEDRYQLISKNVYEKNLQKHMDYFNSTLEDKNF
jgi:hypothetical protein